MFHICQKYAFIVTIMEWSLFKNQGSQQKCSKQKVWEKENGIYETYKNTVMPHGRCISAKAYHIANTTICDNSQYDNLLPHWKCVFRCCAQCPSINIPYQETDDNHHNPSTSICYHIYHLITRCTNHGKLPLSDKNNCR